jgi:parallel beta-helix repeat protein
MRTKMFNRKAIWLVFCLFFIFQSITRASPTFTDRTYSPTITKTTLMITVPDNYSMIQQAINAASPGDTVFVKSGIYHEHIMINKTIMLIGENPSNTIIDGDAMQNTIVLVNQSNVIVENLTVTNTISTLDSYGILISRAQNVSLFNITVREAYRGIVLYEANYSRVSDSQVSNNYAYGIALRSTSQFNNFMGNNIISNPTGASLELSCADNTFFHNNFINNQVQVDSVNYGNHTKWDNGYLSGGNYWSDYQKAYPDAAEIDNSGIWNIPYRMGGANDSYPLMNPWKRPIYPIANFDYSPAKPVVNEQVMFNASASYAPEGHIADYQWNFGDGNITTVSNSTLIHSYVKPGDYNITLTVTDNATLTDSIIKTLPVTKRISNLSIRATPAKVEIRQSVIINGNLSIEGEPPSTAENIGINYTMQGEASWSTLMNVNSSLSGFYQYNWTSSSIGVYMLRAFWNGNANTNSTYSAVIAVNITKESSTLTITATPTTVVIGASILITGKLTPSVEIENITITYGLYFNGTLTWHLLTTVQTDPNGNYSWVWTTTTMGDFYKVKASWPGDDLTYGSNSTTGFITISGLPSSITINVDKETVTVGSNITISGNLTPTCSNATIKILINEINGTGFWVFANQTNADSDYMYVWKTSNAGTFNITASWQGTTTTKPAESKQVSVSVQLSPQTSSITDYAIGIALLVIIIAAIVLKLRKK